MWFDKTSGNALPVNDDGLLRREILDKFADRFTTIMSPNVPPGEATDVLEEGAPCLGQAKKAHNRLTRGGRQPQANCLEAVVSHTVWMECHQGGSRPDAQGMQAVRLQPEDVQT